MHFLVRVQDKMFLVVEDNLKSAKSTIEKYFGKIELLDLTTMKGDFIIEVSLVDLTKAGLALMKIDGGVINDS